MGVIVQSVCVFCGSSNGKKSSYLDEAREIGKFFAERKIRVVYGGGSNGLMGTVAESALKAGGEVIGVIPETLLQKEVAHQKLTKLHITTGMHERKALMAELSDAFIALPGGLGTMDELFEIWTWSQLGLHRKPIGLLNGSHYYDDLLKFLKHTAEEQFVKTKNLNTLVVADSVEKLWEKINTHFLANQLSGS
ncbi:MAG: TIGR00730 family Rossman fold protein [Chloroherpetonaceae bacterium]|nr:TIGR00730 family Rossman fold protein [Chloroherpetonaceae bacterium]